MIDYSVLNGLIALTTVFAVFGLLALAYLDGKE